MKSLGVVRFTYGWAIITGGKRWGRFGYQVDAEEAALRLAAKAAADGHATEILVQGTWGEMRRLALVEAA